MSQREIVPSSSFREVNVQRAQSYVSIPCTPDEDLNVFISNSRKFQEAVSLQEQLYKPDRTSSWNDGKWMLTIFHSFISTNQKQLTLGTQDDYQKIENTIQKIRNAIEDTYKKLNLQKEEYNLGRTFITCFDFRLKKVFVIPLFKVYTFHRGSPQPTIYITKNLRCFNSFNEFLEKGTVDLPHCFICVPRGGEYQQISPKMPLEFFNVNTHRAGTSVLAALCYSLMWNVGQVLLLGTNALIPGIGCFLGVLIGHSFESYCSTINLMEMEPGTTKYEVHQCLVKYFDRTHGRVDVEMISKMSRRIVKFLSGEGMINISLDLLSISRRYNHRQEAREGIDILWNIIRKDLFLFSQIPIVREFVITFFSSEFTKIGLMQIGSVMILKILCAIYCNWMDKKQERVGLPQIPEVMDRINSVNISGANGDYSLQTFNNHMKEVAHVRCGSRAYSVEMEPKNLPETVNGVISGITEDCRIFSGNGFIETVERTGRRHGIADAGDMAIVVRPRD